MVKIKNKLVIISIFTIIVVLLLIFCFIFNDYEEYVIKNYKNDQLLKKYYEVINDIYTNMEYVSISNNEVNKDISWTSYKLEMSEVENSVYDSLVRDIRYCYVYFTDDGNEYTNSNYLDKFKELDKISKKAFKEEIKLYSEYNKSCLDNFDKYEDLFLNNDLKDLEVIVRPLLIYKDIYNMDVNNYEDLLKNEYYKASLIKNISDFLVLKYDNEK